MHFDRPILVIAGPTASGKSSLAISLAKEINGVIINADSKQVYKELTIGTAKPIPDEIIGEKEWIVEGITHYLFGFVSVKDPYHVYQYQKDVQEILDKLPKDKVPILVGGTGMYIDSVVFNYQLTETKNAKLRDELLDLSVEELQKKIDKDILEKLNDSDRNNPARLIRIIERGDINTEKKDELNHMYFVVDKDTEELKKRISQRADIMFEEGLLEENERLKKDDLFNTTVVQKTIGYSEFEEYFEKEKTLEEVKKDIITHTNQYAKRQRTWFRKNKNAVYIKDYDSVLKQSLKFIKTS